MHFADFIAGSVGGACGVVVGFPLDTVKVRIQTQSGFSGVWQCVRCTARSEGVPGFFKGLSLPLLTVSLTSSLAFGTFHNCLQCLGRIRGPDAPSTPLDVFLSGLMGGVVQVCVMSPGDVVKVRLQCETGRRSHGPLHCLLSVCREEGVAGLYRGALPLALRDGPSFATYFLTYHTLTARLKPSESEAALTLSDWAAVPLAGGVAGMAGWAVATPMDVVKARLQMDGVRGGRSYRGLVHCLCETVRTEGVALFGRTLLINCLRAFPVNMTVFSCYELTVRLMTSLPLQAA